jgi:hypothetical protein
MLLSPVSPTVIYLGKLTANPDRTADHPVCPTRPRDYPVQHGAADALLAGIVVIGTIGYVSLTTLLSTMGGSCADVPCCCRCWRCRCSSPCSSAPCAPPARRWASRPGRGPWLLLMGVFALWSTLLAVILFPLAVER